MTKCKNDPLYKKKTIELFHRDPLFAFNAFFYTYDTRKRPLHFIPFATWDYEDEMILELVNSIEGREDCLIEKSRDMGVTWTVLEVFQWFWLKPGGGYDFLCGSRKEDYVDKQGDPRTHFAKLRFNLYKLPKWLMPRNFKPRRDDNYMKLVNYDTGAAITGESNNANFSTQGRYSAILFDEFAKWESTDESAWTAAGDASPSRIPVSTPFGAGGQYYNLATGGKTKRLRYHWSRHPEKGAGLSCIWPPKNDVDREELEREGKWKPLETLSSPWYEKELDRRGPLEIAQELDIDYLGSGNPIFDGKAWRNLMFYHEAGLAPVKWMSLDIEGLVAREVPKPLDNEGFLVIFANYRKDFQYVIGADVVEGVEGGDYAVIKVLNRETKDVDATYFSPVDEVTLARICYIISKTFEGNEAPWLAIETNGPGLATFDKADELGIENLFMMPKYDTAKGGVSFKKGWRTGVDSRNMLIAGVRLYLIERAGKIDDRLVGECMTFVRNRFGKAIAKSGCHDDEIFAFGIALQVDQIVPYEPRAAPLVLRADGLPVGVHDPAKANKVEELSMEELCAVQAMAKRGMMEGERDFWETKAELNDLMMSGGMMELLDDW